MNTENEALVKALEAMETIQVVDEWGYRQIEVVRACKLALAQEESVEPVGIVTGLSIANNPRDFEWYRPVKLGAKLYLAPPKSEWVGLSEDDADHISITLNCMNGKDLELIAMTEAKLKELNK